MQGLRIMFIVIVFIITISSFTADGGWLDLTSFVWIPGINVLLFIALNSKINKFKINPYIQLFIAIAVTMVLEEKLEITEYILLLSLTSYFIYIDIYVVFLDSEKIATPSIIFLVPLSLSIVIAYIDGSFRFFSNFFILAIIFTPPIYYLLKTILIPKFFKRSIS